MRNNTTSAGCLRLRLFGPRCWAGLLFSVFSMRSAVFLSTERARRLAAPFAVQNAAGATARASLAALAMLAGQRRSIYRPELTTRTGFLAQRPPGRHTGGAGSSRVATRS